MTARTFNRPLSENEKRNIVEQLLHDGNQTDIEYVLGLAMQFNEDLFTTIVQTIQVTPDAMQALIKSAVRNANEGEHTNHACPIFLQVRRLASKYLHKDNHIDLCGECGRQYKTKQQKLSIRRFEQSNRASLSQQNCPLVGACASARSNV